MISGKDGKACKGEKCLARRQYGVAVMSAGPVDSIAAICTAHCGARTAIVEKL
jgi:alkyl hydroperoxide reductase subunit AhpF